MARIKPESQSSNHIVIRQTMPPPPSSPFCHPHCFVHTHTQCIHIHETKICLCIFALASKINSIFGECWTLIFCIDDRIKGIIYYLCISKIFNSHLLHFFFLFCVSWFYFRWYIRSAFVHLHKERRLVHFSTKSETEINPYFIATLSMCSVCSVHYIETWRLSLS